MEERRATMLGTGAARVEGASECAEVPRITKLTVFLAVAVFATSAYANVPHALGLRWFYRYIPPFNGKDASLLDHLGGEHRSIAVALSSGRGFADPFQEQTGPTAWVAPVLPTIQALLMVLGGMNVTVVAIAALQSASLIFTGWLVLRAAARCEWRHAPVVSLVLFLAGTWSYFHSSYQFTHDAWVIMFLVGVLFYLTDRYWTSSMGRGATVAWGLVGGVAILSAPVLGPVWLALTALLSRSSGRARPFIVSLLVSLAVMSPWIVRNALVFERFIPVKSNLFFEVYQSNALEPDGVLRDETGNTHPFRNAGTERARYRELGEIAYLDDYRARTLEMIRRNPFGYLAKVRNRFLAATIFFHPFSRNEGARQVLIRSLIYPLPFLALVVIVVSRGWARNRLVVIALVIYGTYLTPYLLVAYYRRYAMPLLGLQVMFEIWALVAIRAQLIHPARDTNPRLATACGPMESAADE